MNHLFRISLSGTEGCFLVPLFKILRKKQQEKHELEIIDKISGSKDFKNCLVTGAIPCGAIHALQRNNLLLVIYSQ